LFSVELLSGVETAMLRVDLPQVCQGCLVKAIRSIAPDRDHHHVAAVFSKYRTVGILVGVGQAIAYP
jgi:hypothetical protein